MKFVVYLVGNQTPIEIESDSVVPDSMAGTVQFMVGNVRIAQFMSVRFRAG